MIQGGMLPIFFLILKIWRHFFEFSSSQGKRQSLKKTGCSYIFQFFVNPKKHSKLLWNVVVFSKSGHNLASEAPAHLSQVPAVDQRTGPANSTGAGNITLDTDMCDARIRSKTATS